MENHLNSGQGLAFEGLFQLYREERNQSTFSVAIWSSLETDSGLQ